MKKAISLAILIICLFVIYQYGITFFKKSHEVSYTVYNNDLSFSIHENFKNGQYFFKISVGDYSFYLEQDNDFNKMRQVIENIDVMKSEEMLCIYPNFKENIQTTITCHDRTRMYSYESVKSTSLVQQFVEYLKTNGNQPVFLKTIENKEEKSGGILYNSNALDELVTVWTYQGFSGLSKERSFDESPLSFDRYDNTISRLVGKYYLLPLYIDNRLYEFSAVEIFDVTNNSTDTIGLGTTLSNYTYVNGIVDNRLYLFDPNTMQQVEINPKGKTAKIVASGNENAIYYYNGDWSTRNIYDFSKEKISFQNFDDTPLKSLYSYTNVFDNKNSYYIYDGTKIYQVYKDFLETPKLLFEQVGMKDIKVVDGYIYYILGNVLYKYTPNEERRAIVTYDEFSYNASNLYDIYRK